MPLPVSVQICTLNEESNIRDCLELIAANHPEEIIVIDGGSVDRTVQIATEMGVRVLLPGKLGLGPSRQLGWNSTECPYVAFVDADDRLPSQWLGQMLGRFDRGHYSALQGTLRVSSDGSWWSSCWNEYFLESIKCRDETNMIGRPAVFLTQDLKRLSGVLPSLDEDTHLSKHFEILQLRQGIADVESFRLVEKGMAENVRKWASYGRGYRQFVREYPESRGSVLKHILFTIPVSRSVRPVMRRKLSQPIFGMLMSIAILSGYLRHRDYGARLLQSIDDDLEQE